MTTGAVVISAGTSKEIQYLANFSSNKQEKQRLTSHLSNELSCAARFPVVKVQQP